MAFTTPYDAYFADASQKYSVDYNLLRAIGLTESGYNSNAISSAGAVGVMQLMPSTAAAYKVKDSRNPEQNINGAAHLLSDLLDTYGGDIDKTLAAYNTGLGTVAKYGITSAGQSYIDKVKDNYAKVSEGNSVNNIGWWDDTKENFKEFGEFFSKPLGEGNLLWWTVKIILIITLAVLCVFFGYKAIGG